MDIFDAQVHLNHFGPLEAGMAAMRGVGIAGLMFDEFGEADSRGYFMPGELLENGIFRPTSPGAEAAAAKYPERFGVLRRVHYRDPGLKEIARSLADAPYAAALRAVMFLPEEIEAMARGELDTLIQIGADHDLPVVILPPGRAELIEAYVERFPSAKLVIDHCGARLERSGPVEVLEAVARLARHPNVTLKWSNAAFFFARTGYPFPDLKKLLRRMVDAFGADRVMWGTDATMNNVHSWAEQLFHIRDAEEFSDDEKEWLLGRTARKVFKVPAGASAG